VSRELWRWWRPLAGLVVLAVVLRFTGLRPVTAALTATGAGALGAGVALGLASTLACAWRWKVVAAGLGTEITLGRAFGAYYRSQFLNTTLPGGVLGDVHRGLDHGRRSGVPGRGLRGVLWERLAGQVVQLTVAAVVLLLLPSPVPRGLTVTAGMVLVLLGVSWLRPPLAAGSRLAQAMAAGRQEARRGVLGRHLGLEVAVASTIALAGHLATFLVAARAAGVSASVSRLLPLALLVLVTMGLPTNLAGWGPREGMAAWSFAAAGLGAGKGVTTAVVYGLMTLVASLPGAVVLLTTWWPAKRGSSQAAACAEPLKTGGVSRG
jgi:glycosyltransferase 2 family protein